MKQVFSFLIALFSLLILSCGKDKPASHWFYENAIHFDQLQLGQQSRYLRFSAGTPGTNDVSIHYFPDTLVLQVVDKVADTFILKEYLTLNSYSLLHPNADDALYQKDTLEVKFFIDQQKVHVFGGSEFSQAVSRIFSNLSFSLIEIDNFLLQSATWYPDPQNNFTDHGHLKNYEQLGVNFPRLNFASNYFPMLGDGPGWFYYYSAEDGIVRSGVRNGWFTDTGLGWDLLTE